MRNLFRRSATPTKVGPLAVAGPAEHIECERVTATAVSPVHIRTLGADRQTFPSGGLPSRISALCGRDMQRGWDVGRGITPQEARQTREHVTAGQPGALCRMCVAVLTQEPLTREADRIDAAFPDRSAGRWCGVCGRHGSHHTDKHGEFYYEAVRQDEGPSLRP